MTAIAVGAIHIYRRHLSPRKGYRCAHNALHRCGSCSDFGLKVYQRLTFGAATALMLRRLTDCRAAYATILALKAVDQPEEKSDRGKRGNSFCSPVDAINCVPLPDVACLDIGACDIFSCVPW